MTVYLQPTGPIASKALLPGDPKRAMELATTLLGSPRMSNLSRGLWGYHGETDSGDELTVQSTGIGAPSTAIVAHELAALGVLEAIRVGTCVALDPELALGTVVLASSGLSSQTGKGGLVEPEPSLTERLQRELDPGAEKLTVAPIERYYDSSSSATRAAWRRAGARVADLCTVALLEAGAELGFAAASLLLVSEDAAGARLEDVPLEERLLELGGRAAGALLGAGNQSSSEAASRD